MSEKMTGKIFDEKTKKKISDSKKSIINIYCSNGILFNSWEAIYKYLIENKLSATKYISVCRQTIYTVLDKEDRNCYGLKWKTSPFLTDEEKNISSKFCSNETK